MAATMPARIVAIARPVVRIRLAAQTSPMTRGTAPAVARIAWAALASRPRRSVGPSFGGSGMSGDPERPLSRPSIPGRCVRRSIIPRGTIGGPLRLGPRWAGGAASGRDGGRDRRVLPDLVEEGKGAGIPLEDVAEEVAQRGFHLPLGREAETETGDGFHVLALVGLQELEASSVRPDRSWGGPGHRSHSTPPSDGTQRKRPWTSRTRSHSTQRSTSGRTPSSSA